MDTCKSIILRKYNDYDSIKIEVCNLPPIEGRIEVEVHYCGMNFSDVYIRLGLFKKELPITLGTECCGVIRNVGIEIDSLKIGQRVICFNYLGGMYSEIIRVLPNEVFPIPNDIPFDVGATIFVNYLTAYFALNELGSFKQNETVLINSCAGGVGWATTQLAKLQKNTKIYGTSSVDKEKYVLENGVDKVFRYDTLIPDLKKAEPNGVDVIIENQAGNTLHENLNLLKPLGRMVLIGMNSAIINDKLSYYALLKMWWKSWWFSLTDLVMNNRCITGLHLGTLLENDRGKVVKALDYLITLLKQEKIKPRIDSVWPMEQYQDALKLISERKNVGKILIRIKQEKE